MFKTLKRLLGKKERSGHKEPEVPYSQPGTESVDLATGSFILMPMISSPNNSSAHCDSGSSSYDSDGSCDSGSGGGD